MGTTLQHGIFLPAEGERNCYAGLASNWTIIDGVVGGYSSHAANLTIHVTAADKEAWNGKADTSALTAHTGDTTIHVTAEDKTKWDAVTTKANDADVVHTSGNETVGGQKTFTNNISLRSLSAEYAVSGGSNSLLFYDKNSLLLSLYKLGVYGSGLSYQVFSILGYDSNNQQVSKSITFSSSYLNLSTAFLKPDTDNAIALGRNNYKWSDVQTYKVNGLEPSSLSLPSGNVNDVIDISSYLVNLDGTANTYTAPANGWISIAITGTAISIVSSSWSDSRLRESSGNVRMLYPVLKNKTLDISVTGTTLAYARFIPCQGNA